MMDEKDLQAIAQMLKAELAPINDRLDKMDGRMDQMQGDISDLRTTVTGMQKDISSVQKDISDLRDTVTRVAVTQENVVLPRLQLLAEGHDTLLETLARKEQVEALKDDVATQGTAIMLVSQRVTKLEKAQ